MSEDKDISVMRLTYAVFVSGVCHAFLPTGDKTNQSQVTEISTRE
jgi:hypothetical protein